MGKFVFFTAVCMFSAYIINKLYIYFKGKFSNLKHNQFKKKKGIFDIMLIDIGDRKIYEKYGGNKDTITDISKVFDFRRNDL